MNDKRAGPGKGVDDGGNTSIGCDLSQCTLTLSMLSGRRENLTAKKDLCSGSEQTIWSFKCHELKSITEGIRSQN